MTDTITLTRKEVEEAIISLQRAYEAKARRWGCFGHYDEECYQDFEDNSPCYFCLKLTEFARGEA